jgi:hypothetical protein
VGPYYTTSADSIWGYWGTTTAATTDYTWLSWTAGNTATTADVNITWGDWNVIYRPTYVYQSPAPRQRTPEEIAAAEEARLHVEEQARIRREEQAAAVAAAERLLVENLNPYQRRRYRKHGHFDVRTRSGRRFRITRGWTHNVFELDHQGKRIKTYCIHPREKIPDQDNMLAQKFLLEHDEATFLARAY